MGTGTKIIIGYLKVLKDQSPLVNQGIKINSSDVAINNQEVDNKQAEKKQEPETPVEVRPEEIRPVVQERPENVNAINTGGTINFNGGKFKSLYNDQIKNRSLENESGVAATFKTTSGWQDGKYYCFHNTAQPATIIKITNNANGKVVYAKVLDAIPDIKQNSGLLLRISNSAAAELGGFRQV